MKQGEEKIEMGMGIVIEYHLMTQREERKEGCERNRILYSLTSSRG